MNTSSRRGAQLILNLLLAIGLLAQAAGAAPYTIQLQPGRQLIANHLNQPPNTIARVLDQAVDGDRVERWNPATQSFTPTIYESEEWSDGGGALSFGPGEAVFYVTGQPRPMDFQGQLPPPGSPLELVPGRLYFRGSRTPLPVAGYEDIVGAPPVEGVQLLRWLGDVYETNTYAGGQWALGAPAIPLGEGVALLLPVPPPAPPVITQPPRGGTLVPGESLTLGVAATGTGALRYQWTQLGTPPLPRGTDPVLVLGPVSAADAGQYVVEVRDDVDAVTSAPATVVVVTPGGFFDDFEGYPSGADLLSGGGWHGWAEDPAAGGLVQTGRAFSPTRAVCVQGAGDLARRIAGVTGGQWVLTLRQFIPSSSAGTHYVNVLNRYRPPYTDPELSWSIQIQCDTAAGRVISDLGGGASLPLIKDEWIEIRCEIDLAANTVREFYHGELLAEHPWRGGEGDLALAALNLYAHGSGPACYDDVRLEQAEAPGIVEHPESRTVDIGDSVTFSVTATGTEPLRYHWIFCPRPNWDFPDILPPPTGPILAIPSVQPADLGDYLVVIANSFGMVTSRVARLLGPCTPPPPGLVAWWPLDEPNGSTTVNDLAGSINDQGTTVQGSIGSSPLAPSSVPAVVGTALCFPPGTSPSPGPNVNVEVPSGPEVNFGTTDFSIDAWIKLGPGTGNIYPIVDKLDYSVPGSNRGYALFVQGGQLLLRLGPDNFGGLVAAASTFSTPISPGQWHFIAVTVERTPMKPKVTFYLDGIADGPHLTAGPNFDASNNMDSTTSLWIGGHSRLAGGGATVSRGEICIDELEYFHHELTPGTVQSLYLAGSAGKCKSTCINPPAGLVSWWPGDNNATDIWNGNHGTLVGGATFNPGGMVGAAFSLDGINDYVRIATSPNLNPIGSFTIDAWIYMAADGTFPIVTKWGDIGLWIGQRAYALHTTPGRGLNFAISDSANQGNTAFHTFTTPGGQIPLNTWTLVAGVYDQSTGTRRIFVNGVQVASRTDPPITITPSIADLTIGNWLRSPVDEDYFFPGLIDEVEIFDRALSQSEIQAIFNAGSAGKCKSGCQTPLVLTCASNKTVQCGSAWSFDPPTTTQPDCTNVTIIVLSTVTNGICPQIVTRTWQAVDCCNNIASCSQSVTIVDTNPPVFTACPVAPIHLGCNPIVRPAGPLVIAAAGPVNDDCDANPAVTATAGPITGTCQKQVVWTVTAVDACGNASTCRVTYTWIEDTTLPAICCPPDIVRYACTNAVQVFYAAQVRDNCGGASTLSYNPPSGTWFAAGTTTLVTATATDPCGNTNQCTFRVTVRDQSVWQTLVSGVDDCYRRGWLWWWRNPEPVSGPSACLLSAFPTATWKHFDDATVNRFVGNSWQNLPSGIVEAHLDTRMRPPVNGCAGTSGNDTISLGLSNCTPPSWLWSRHLGSGNPNPGLVNAQWCNGRSCQYPFSFNLSALPLAGSGTVSLLPHMNSAKRLDFMVQDDTTVDYARLRIRYCLPGPVVGGLNTSLANAIFGRRCWWWWIAPDPGMPVATPFSARLSVGGAGGITVGTPVSALPANAEVSFVLKQIEGTAADTNAFGTILGKAIKEHGIQYSAEIPAGTGEVELVLSLQGQVVHAGTVAVPPGSSRMPLLELLDMEAPVDATLKLLKRRPDRPPHSSSNSPSATLHLAESRVVEGVFGQKLVDTISIAIYGNYDSPLYLDGADDVDLIISGFNVPEIELKDIRLEVAGEGVAYGGNALARADADQLVLSPFDPIEGDPVWFSVACAPTNEFRVFVGEASPPMAKPSAPTPASR